MFERVEIRVADGPAAARFYTTVLAALDLTPAEPRAGALPAWADFSLADADAGHPPTRRLHLGFAAPTRAHVDAFWEAGTTAGYRDDGAPGPRGYTPDYYGAFLLDPAGNSAEAVHYAEGRTDGAVDHLWIRVADVAAIAAAHAFYEQLAPHAGLRVRRTKPDYLIIHGRDAGSFSFLPGPPTENLRLALAATDGIACVAQDPNGHPVELVERPS